MQLLTLLSENYNKREMQEKLSVTVSKYLLDKSWKIKKEKGVYAQADLKIAHPLSTKALNIVLELRG